MAGHETAGGRCIRYVPLDAVRRAPRNAKTHDVDWIKSLIARFGFVGAAVHDGRTDAIIAGHGRLESLEQMAAEGQHPPDGIATGPGGTWMMPVEYGWSSHSDAEAEALAIALNESTTRGGWDERQLAETLRDLNDLDADLRRVAGWDDAGFEQLTAQLDDAGPGEGDADPDDVPEPPAGEPVTKPGDLWLLGPHQLLCGNSTLPDDLDRLLGGRTVGCVLADPPYGMNLDTDYSKMPGAGVNAQMVRKPKKYRPVEGDDEPFDASFLRTYFAAVREQFWFGADYYRHTLGEDDRDGSWLVWDKRTEEQDDVIGSGFELCWSANRHQRRLLRHYWCGAFGNPEARNRYHPTQKPTALLRDILDRWAPSGCVVADPHGGSGSTLVAAHQTGRIAALVELDPRYCDVILARFATHTGITPINAETGEKADFTADNVTLSHTGKGE